MTTKEIFTLLEKFKSGKLNNQELSRLKQLFESSSALKDLLQSMQMDYDLLKLQIQEYPIYPNQEKTKNRILQSILNQNPHKSTKRFPFHYLGWALVASLVIAGIFLYPKKSTKPQEIVWETISTIHGEQKHFRLSDSTEIKLNGNSSITYAKSTTGQLRIVKLNGEAFFDVAKDPQRPFLILSKDFVTRVVGTSFNIDSDIEKSVEVNSGKVKVFQMDEKTYSTLLNQDLTNFEAQITQSTGDKVELNKGERAVLTNNNWEVKSFNNNNWYNKELVHFGEKLSTILKKAYRYYGDSIIVSPDIANTKTTITFKRKSIEQVLQTLAEMNNANLIKKSDQLWEIKKK